MSKISGSNKSSKISDSLLQPKDMKPSVGLFTDKSAKIETDTKKSIGIDQNEEKWDIKDQSNPSGKNVDSKKVESKQPVQTMLSQKTDDKTGVFGAQKSSSEQNKQEGLSLRSNDGEEHLSNQVKDEEGEGGEGGISRGGVFRQPIKKRRQDKTKRDAKTNLDTQKNTSTALNEQLQKKSKTFFNKKIVQDMRANISKVLDRLFKNDAQPSKSTIATEQVSKAGGGLASLLKNNNSKSELVVKALNGSGLDELKGLNSKNISKKHKNLVMERVFNIYADYTLEELNNIKKNDTPKEWRHCINCNLIKRQIGSNGKDNETEMFRKSGKSSTIKLIDKNVSNNTLLTEVKNDSDVAVLSDVNALSGYVKQQLTNKCQIEGTEEKSYTEAFNKLTNINDKILFISLVNGIYDFCLQAQANPSDKRNLHVIGLSVPCLYGSARSQDEMFNTKKSGSMDVNGEDVESAKATTIEVMESFLKNWPIAKAQINLK